MIGRTDIVLWARDDLPVADLILRIVRRHWPALVVDEADDLAPPGHEFFLHADEGAARSWEEEGATPENVNTMLHVILGDGRNPDLGLRQITLVCDELDGEMRSMIDEIRSLLQNGDTAPKSVGR